MKRRRKTRGALEPPPDRDPKWNRRDGESEAEYAIRIMRMTLFPAVRAVEGERAAPQANARDETWLRQQCERLALDDNEGRPDS